MDMEIPWGIPSGFSVGIGIGKKLTSSLHGSPAWFCCLLRQSAGKRGRLNLQLPSRAVHASDRELRGASRCTSQWGRSSCCCCC